MWRSATLASVMVLSAGGAQAQTLRNWFNDPFFPISSAIAACPEPAGPRVSERDRQVQAHHRAEKGTTCWLAQEEDCERSNAFGYDQDIAAEIRAALLGAPRFANTSLWVTVQGRRVFIEGCVAESRQATELESLVRALPHVQQAIAIVRANPAGKPPYKVLPSR